MIICGVVEEEKMVNSVANLNISVSNLFVNIVDMLMADITHGVVNNRLPTQKLALKRVSIVFQELSQMSSN